MTSEERMTRGIDHLGPTVPGFCQASELFARAFSAEVLYDLVDPGLDRVGPIDRWSPKEAVSTT